MIYWKYVLECNDLQISLLKFSLDAVSFPFEKSHKSITIYVNLKKFTHEKSYLNKFVSLVKGIDVK